MAFKIIKDKTDYLKGEELALWANERPIIFKKLSLARAVWLNS